MRLSLEPSLPHCLLEHRLMVPRVPKFNPIIPVHRPDIFHTADWVYEVKYDGFRALAYIEDGRWLVSRNGNEMKRFEDVCVAMAKELNVSNAVLDGEVTAVDESGMPAFYDLLKRKRQAVYLPSTSCGSTIRTCVICRCLSERRSYARLSLNGLAGSVT